MQTIIQIPEWASYVISDLTDMDRNPHPVNSSAVSKFTLNLADDVYFEYAFLDASGKMWADPLNTVKADNPWYPTASAIVGPVYLADALASPSLKAGGLVKRFRHASDSLVEKRKIITYTPQGFETEALPVIYIQDGVAYYRIAKLPEVLESLVQANKVRPAHLVFVEPNDRTKEYRYNPDYRAFMIEELIPLIENELKTTNERTLMGASLGGLLSATLALHHPDLFQSVISQSGAFLGSPEEPDFYTGKTSWVLDELKNRETLALRWYLETGTLEWLTGINRELKDALESKNYAVEYVERNAGHNWVNWRNGVAKALLFALS